MIKINLLNSLGLDQGAVGGEALTPDLQKQAIMRGLVVLLFPILLYVYETVNISNLTAQLKAVQTKVQDVDKQKGAYGDAAPKVEKYTKLKTKIDHQLEVIRELSRNRLRGVKALDSLQTLAPSQVWFRNIIVSGDDVKAEGYSNTEEGVSTLYASLNNSPVFSRFEPKDQTEEVLGGNRVKKFDVEFHIGRQGAD